MTDIPMEDDSEEEVSLDDVLEEERTDPLNHKIGQEALPEDNDTPVEPASPVPGQEHWPDDHPSQDTNIDPEEKYQDG